MSGWTEGKPFGVLKSGPRDSFVVTLAEGRRIETTTIDRFEEVVRRAQCLATETDLAVKVLPMTAREYIAFAGIRASDLAASPEAEADLRKLTVETLRTAMVDAPDQATRAEARDLLTSMGEIASSST
jgi:hypothetical protein